MMAILNSHKKPSLSRGITLFYLSVIVGVGAGFLGLSLALLLHWIQHTAYGYSLDRIISNISFYEGVSLASPERRFFCLFLCGLIAGLGWYWLYRYGKPLVSIKEALSGIKKMPFLSTAIHALLQISTIALGSPLGREVAPRELGALWAAWLTEKVALSAEETKIMIACGAGAGLAAVYNVPLGGALFTLEVLLATYRWSVLVPALMTSAIATLVSWTGLGIESVYQVPELHLNASIILWSICTGPVFGYSAFWFMRIANQQRQNAVHDKKIIWKTLLNFCFIGLLALYFPVILGNGKSLVQMEFTNTASIVLSALLLFLHCIITWTSLLSGAQGGLLTPSLANGALLAGVLGGLWNLFWPTIPFAGYVVIGGAAFLAAAQKMPLTAIVLIFEFTHIHFDFLVPMMIAVSEALIVYVFCAEHLKKYPLCSA